MANIVLVVVVVMTIWIPAGPQQQQQFGTCSAAPYERVWLRVRSDPSLRSLFDWTEFSASKGQQVGRALEEHGLVAAAGGKSMHLYRLEQIDLNATIEQLNLKPSDKYYLSEENLLEL